MSGASAQNNSPAAKEEGAYSLAGFKILVVEDYPFMASLITTMLREFGVGHMLLAENAEEAQRMLVMFNADPGSRDNIDIVLTDWLMPGGDGSDLMNWIRGHKKDSIKFLPIILCSAFTSEDIVGAGRDHGANEVMVKPLAAKKLANRILHVIDNPRPFIKTPNFFGPDRRRKVEPFDGDDRRKLKPEDVEEHHEQI